MNLFLFVAASRATSLLQLVRVLMAVHLLGQARGIETNGRGSARAGKVWPGPFAGLETPGGG